ncbi:hypothetical protein [Leuconostoc miyukkimchii]|uniref:hypothetical protein n=1 Tax=Leuconostoc miyukkimchii TaxID=910540 RepID=UPI001FE7E1CC|nr:hypothetical protein [Leuconostoc miyukkimchii]
MMKINNEPTTYTPIFLGTTQHSLRLLLQILIMVGMKLNDEIIEAINTVELSAEHEKLVMATTKNAITQASKQLNINFEKPIKKYNEDDEQGKGA